MSDQAPPVPADPRARAFLEMFPGAKLDGFEMVPDTSAAIVGPGGQLLEPPPPPKEGVVTAEKLAVIVAVGDDIFQFALSREQRQIVLMLIAKMHGGRPHLFAEPIQNMNIEVTRK